MYQLEKAIELALKAHNGQKDRYGKSYILHSLRVMMKMENENEMIAAVLHDVVEDSDLTLTDLKKEGFSNEIIDAIDCLTKREGEDYFNYINRAISTPLSKKVKLADLEDNMDIRRVDVLTEKDMERLIRYLKAWSMIKKVK
jgi:(p)ppGpp synthase/HD superfamily hydrolase